MKARPSAEKRRKEQARKDRREEKAARREQRKAERAARIAAGLDPDIYEPVPEYPELDDESDETAEGSDRE